MKIVKVSQRYSDSKGFEAKLLRETETKFIVLTGEHNIELHFPKASYTFKVVKGA